MNAIANKIFVNTITKFIEAVNLTLNLKIHTKISILFNANLNAFIDQTVQDTK